MQNWDSTGKSNCTVTGGGRVLLRLRLQLQWRFIRKKQQPWWTHSNYKEGVE